MLDQAKVSGGSGQASVGSAFTRPENSIEDVAGRERALSPYDLAARSVAPPEALRHAILRADAGERRAILHQSAWVAHVLAQEAGADRYASVERLCVRANAARGELPFDKASMKRAWNTRFLHLLDGASASDVARDMMKWCAAHGDQPSAAAQWHWLSPADDTSLDVPAFAHLPMREWPAAMLGAALTVTNLREAVLPDLSLPNADLRGVNAPGAQFCGGQFNGTAWVGANLRGAGFALSTQIHADFERTDLRETCFRAADVSEVRMVRANLRGAAWLHTVVRGGDLSEALCQGMTFTKVCLDDASFNRARLHGACVINGSARGLLLVDVKAKHSKWTSVVMNHGHAPGADLRGAEFRHCELVGWDARGAKLNGALFEACDLRHARFCGASLKRVRFGRDCDLGGSQWQDTQIRLDDAWLRQLSPVELDQVAQSLMTLPVDQPAMRARVFMQLLVALSRKSGAVYLGQEAALSMQRLPEHVRRSEWFGRLLVAPNETGGVGEQEGFAELRTQWLARKLSELTDVRLSRGEAQWATASLMTLLHGHCAAASPNAVWRYAGAMCQTLYWADEGGGVGHARVNALRSAWFEAMPPQVHVALSADGINALDASYIVLMRADGEVAARLPKHLLASVFGSATASQPKDGDAVFARDPLPGLAWAGTRVVVRDRTSPDDFLPGTMRQLQGLLREFGCLAGLWPVERSLDAFVRLVGRWFGDAGTEAASAACRRPWQPSPVPSSEGGRRAAPEGLSPSDRFDALVFASHSSRHVKLRATGHADIEDVFREFPLMVPDGEAPPSVSMSRRVRLVSVAAGLSWLAMQPEWRSLPSSVVLNALPDGQARQVCRQYALAALNETMNGDAAWRLLPQAVALRACLFDEAGSPNLLAQRLIAWLTCPEVLDLPGVAQACRQTLPWFWAIRLPLDTAAVREAVAAGSLPATEWRFGVARD
ncbi:pentapeptide repeat-containing protein [Pandoraea sp. NPDC087047]|uniref:pentapeptide repeat-containing protein n=1 Tax=Pandoraea sp. NPDC087047 TaxID=3364390 RepID=UPI00381B4730